MGMDPSKLLANVHPRLLDGPNEQQTKNISDEILKKLNMTVQQLKEEKNNRREKVICHMSAPKPRKSINKLMGYTGYYHGGTPTIWANEDTCNNFSKWYVRSWKPHT